MLWVSILIIATSGVESNLQISGLYSIHGPHRSIFEVEQDYFDWELAVTGISDMQREIQRLAAT